MVVADTLAVVEPAITKDFVGTPKLCWSNWGSNGLHVIVTVCDPPPQVYSIGVTMSSIPSLHIPFVWILEPAAEVKFKVDTG